MKKSIPNYGHDAVSGNNDSSEAQDESNYPHIESFVKDLKHPHEIEHAMYHAAKRLHEEGDNLDESSTGSEHDMTQPIGMQDYEKLKGSY